MEDTPKPNAAESPGLLEGDSLKKLLMAKVRAQGGTKAIDSKGLFQSLVQQSLEAFLELELEEHLGYEKHDAAGRGSGNSRNGASGKTVLTDIGSVDLAVPRDRNGTFEPQIVRKGQTRLEGFNDRIIALYARGMTVRDIRAHLAEMYQVDVSPDLISRVTDAVVEELAEWQSRPLDSGRIPAMVANRAGRRTSCPDTRRTRCLRASSDGISS